MKYMNCCLVMIRLKTVCSVVMCECNFPPLREPFTNTGAVHKSVTFRSVFMLVQLNKCIVVCCSDFKRRHSGDGCLSSSILFKYDSSRDNFWFVHLIRSLFSSTYNLWLNSMFWNNLRSVIVL